MGPWAAQPAMQHIPFFGGGEAGGAGQHSQQCSTVSKQHSQQCSTFCWGGQVSRAAQPALSFTHCSRAALQQGSTAAIITQHDSVTARVPSTKQHGNAAAMQRSTLAAASNAPRSFNDSIRGSLVIAEHVSHSGPAVCCPAVLQVSARQQSQRALRMPSCMTCLLRGSRCPPSCATSECCSWMWVC